MGRLHLCLPFTFHVKSENLANPKIETKWKIPDGHYVNIGIDGQDRFNKSIVEAANKWISPDRDEMWLLLSFKANKVITMYKIRSTVRALLARTVSVNNGKWEEHDSLYPSRHYNYHKLGSEEKVGKSVRGACFFWQASALPLNGPQYVFLFSRSFNLFPVPTTQ